MRRLAFVVTTSLAATSWVAVSWVVLAPVGALAAEAALFQFEQQAKRHCPGDAVVWVTPASGIYSFPGDRWYGSTKHGAFVCRHEGDQAGYRPSRGPAEERAAVTKATLPPAAQ